MVLRYFNLSEFGCSCCGKNDMEPSFLIRLDRAREHAGVPFVINSGYRCEKHNQEEGGKSTSSHLRGWAADLRVRNSMERFAIVYGLLMAGFSRIGIGKEFIHVDSDPDKPGMVMWHYYGEV